MDGKGGYRTRAYAFKALGALQDTPQRLEVNGADTSGFAVVAGRDAGNGLVQVLVTHYGKEPLSYKLSVTNLPWGAGEFTVRRYNITNESNAGARQPEIAKGGHLEIAGAVPGYGVELVVLQKK